jgi:hypothetical protein
LQSAMIRKRKKALDERQDATEWTK